MIQRIQSIYLFLAAAALSTSVFFPLASATGEPTLLAATGDNFFADGVFWAKEFPGWIGTLIVVLGAVFAIFLYKNRTRQMQLTGVLALVALLILGLFGVLGFYNAQELPAGTSAHLSIGSAICPIAIPLLWMAYKAIKKDDDLVRSSDRLR